MSKLQQVKGGTFLRHGVVYTEEHFVAAAWKHLDGVLISVPWTILI